MKNVIVVMYKNQQNMFAKVCVIHLTGTMQTLYTEDRLRLILLEIP